MSTERAAPFYCPYCGDEDLRPHDEYGTWHCRACARVFRLSFIGLRIAESPPPGDPGPGEPEPEGVRAR